GNDGSGSDFRKKPVEVEPRLQHLLKEKLTMIDEHIKDLQKLRQHVGAFLDSPKDVFNQVYLPKNFTIECRYNHVSNIEKQ
ncbi:hypothetical protein ACXJCM_003302, partial [Listeria monocytogenes]